jgi:hypothetical protein
VLARAHRGGGLQPWLAAWFAAILVLAPCARPLLPLDLTAAAPAQATPGAYDDTEGKEPAAGLISAGPRTLGILSRPALVETTLGPPPTKLPLLRRSGDQPVLARGAAATVLGGEPRAAFQRSAVGTARKPTGPPA